MRSPLRQIIAVFVIVALIPVSFIVYELGSLNKNEEIVREIYRNQLDAILYSVNQYSDDIISSWANRITIEFGKNENVLLNDSTVLRRLQSFLTQLSAVDYFYFSDLKSNAAVLSNGDLNEDNRKLIEDNRKLIKDILDDLALQQKEKISRLITYHRAGFKKMEAIDTVIVNNRVPVLFVMDHGGENYHLGIMVIDLPDFLKSILGPKMQAIAQEKFILSAFHANTDSLVYSTETVNPEAAAGFVMGDRELKEEGQQKDFWLLPGYYLEISLKGATIDDLVNDRVKTSRFILFFLIVILTGAIWFLYRNIRREVILAQAKSEFVSNVSHEIRTPLSMISMYTETLEMNRVPEDKKKEYYSIIVKETARLSGIVNRILNFSQIEANKKAYQIKPIELNGLCKEVLESYHFHLRDKGFECVFVKQNDEQMIVGDRASISEAIINLLDNAIKYSHDKKTITLKTGSEKNFSFIEVRDEGIGIPKNYQHEIFDPFYRAPTGDVHNTKGSGLGLTLVKKTVEAHRGKIKVDSAPGKGSTFRLYFPSKNVVAS